MYLINIILKGNALEKLTLNVLIFDLLFVFPSPSEKMAKHWTSKEDFFLISSLTSYF